MAQPPKKKLGDLLVEFNIISNDQLMQALDHQKKTKERLGKALVSLGFVTQQQINEILEFQLGIPQVSLMRYQVPPDISKLIPENICRRHMVFPIRKISNRLTVAMADPLNLMAIDDIKIATNLEVDPAISAENEIEQLISKTFGLATANKNAFKDLESSLTDVGPRASVFDMELIDLDKADATGDAPIVRVVNTILHQAAKDGVSDIHIEVHEGKLRVRYRMDGMLRDVMNLPKQAHASLVSRIKILAEMDIAEKRIPQDGRIQIKLASKAIDLRVSTLPTIFGEKVVIRLLDKSAILFKLEQLGFQNTPHAQYQRLIRNSYGMILITGPTGSGKTTTLYATINEINDAEKNIVTVEDPVEYVLDGVNQVQVNVKAGMTFASGLRSILRQDPDIVLVGEIRDGETADIAVRAATTGHLVLSTLHTNDAAGAIARLIDMGVEPFLVASSVVGVVAQRLVRTICKQCKTSYQLEFGAPERLFLGFGHDEPVTLYKGRGCMACNNTGYKGRLAIQEVMTIGSKQRDLILSKAASDSIRNAAIQDGMISLRDDGIYKALEGHTTVQEVMRVAFTTD